MGLVAILTFQCSTDKFDTHESFKTNEVESKSIIKDLNEFFLMNNVSLDNEMLNFKTVKRMVAFLQKIENSEYKDSDLNLFENEIGFTSFRRIYAAAIDDLENSTSEVEYKSKLIEYSSIVSDKDLSPNIVMLNMLPVLNNEGFIKMEGVIYKYNEEAVIVAHENTINAVNKVENSRATKSNGFYEFPAIIDLRGSCSNTYSDQETEGDKRARLKYTATKHTTYHTVTECDYEYVWDPVNEKYEYKLVCREVTKPKSVILGVNIDGAAFRKVLWTWHLYSTELDLLVDMELEPDGITYHIEYDEHEASAKTIVKNWTTAPDVDLNNPGGFEFNNADLYFKSRGVETAVTHTCN